MVRLLPLSAADLDNLANGEDVCEGMTVADGALSPPEILAILRDVSNSGDAADPIAWLIADGGTAVGMISFTRFVSTEWAVSQDDRHDFGYIVAPRHRNRGFATQAIAALVKIGQARGFKVLTAETGPDNLASEQVLAKNGFTRDLLPAQPSASRLIRWSLALQ